MTGELLVSGSVKKPYNSLGDKGNVLLAVGRGLKKTKGSIGYVSKFQGPQIQLEWYVYIYIYLKLTPNKIHHTTLPKTNSSPLKIGFPNRKLVFQPSMLVSGRVFIMKGGVGEEITWATKKIRSYFPLYWLVNDGSLIFAYYNPL